MFQILHTIKVQLLVHAGTHVLEGFSIQEKAMDVTHSSPHVARYHIDVMLLLVRPTPSWFLSNILYTPVNSKGVMLVGANGVVV